MSTEQTPVAPEPDGWLTDLLPQLTTAQGSILIAIGAITAAALAYLVAYLGRRQTDRHWETSNRQERFTTIATQLADPNAAVRIAAVASMEALIDDHLTPKHWYDQGRAKYRRNPQAQAGINVLCAYLRLPATTHPSGKHTITTETITTTEASGAETEQTHTYSPNDYEVRSSILRTIITHLRANGSVRSWQHLDYDFNGARFQDDADFSEVQFRGQNTLFSEASFDGTTTSFEQVHFYSQTTTFNSAVFRHDANFNRSVFHARPSFSFAKFPDRWPARFRRARFFAGVSFMDTEFSGGSIFTAATFARRSRIDAKFAEVNNFEDALFSGDTTFHGEFLPGSITTFKGARFEGERTSFGYSKLKADAQIDFTGPSSWKNVACPWDHESTAKPENVFPEVWPPLAQK